MYYTVLYCTVQVVNRLDRSPWFGYGIDYSHAMGGIVRNSTGQIVSATTAQMYWRVRCSV